MYYLCPRHRSQLSNLSSAQQHSLWIRWIREGGALYELGLWQEAIPYLGCAYDLAEEMVITTTDGKIPPLLPLVLSAIYLMNSCRHYNDPWRADAVERRALVVLEMSVLETGTGGLLIREYGRIIRDPGRHEAFFRDHLNLPFVSAGPGVETPSPGQPVKAYALS